MRMGFKPYKAKTARAGNNYHAQSGNYESRESKGDRFPIDVITFSNGNNKTVHPTQKPVDLLKYLIKTYTNEGMTVLDNCMGSGSTGVAAKKLNRNFIGMELDKEYFEIAKERIEQAKKQIQRLRKISILWVDKSVITMVYFYCSKEKETI